MTLLEMIQKEGLLFDGAMGTMLINAGLTSGHVSDYWNLEKPEEIQKIHKAYFDSGADIVTTNTFGASRIKLKKANLDTHTEEINTIAVKIANAVASKNQFVAGDIGSTGEMMIPFGVASPEEIQNNFAEQASFLKEAGVDAFIIETMFDIKESIAAIKGVRSVSDLPIFATLTFEYKNNNFATIMGNQAIDSFKQLVDCGADVVGANCSVGSDIMVLLAELLQKNHNGLTIIQPNAGIPKTVNAQLIYPESVDEYANNIIKMKKMGINVVGGCCGTNPDYIKQIKTLLITL